MPPDETILNGNDTLRTIKARHSVRTFTRDEVSEGEIKILLDAANAAPSAHNQQAWRFILLRGDRKQELAQLVTAQSAGFPKPAAALNTATKIAARGPKSTPAVTVTET